MNAGMSLITAVLILMAIGAGQSPSKQQPNAANTGFTTSKIALNHNETLVQDAPASQAGEWKVVTAGRQVTTTITRLFESWFSSGPRPGGCDEWGCGSNHNETLVQDVPASQAGEWKVVTAGRQVTTAITRFVESWFRSVPRPGCDDEFGCGTNHNETIVRDMAR